MIDSSDGGNEQHPGRAFHVARAVGHQNAETGQRLLDAEAEKRKKALEQDDARREQRQRRGDRAGEVRRDMAHEDRRRTDAERPGGDDELLVLQAQRLAAHDARHVEPFDRADGDEDQHEPAPENDDQQDDEEQEGQGVENVDDPHHRPVDAPAGVAGDGAPDDPDRRRDRAAENADEERDAPGDHGAREKIAPVGVGAGEKPDAVEAARRRRASVPSSRRSTTVGAPNSADRSK